MFREKAKEQRKKEMSEMIEAILPTGATVVLFDYNEKHFGNFIVEIEVQKRKHTFVTDRGEIYHNGKMLCDNSYHYIEKEDTFPKLLQMIKKEIQLFPKGKS